MLPAASQATSMGWLKLSPGTPDPGGPPPRPKTPPPALLPTSPIASGLRPKVMRTRPEGSNLTTIREARSTIQKLFWASTLTPCANRKE